MNIEKKLLLKMFVEKIIEFKHFSDTLKNVKRISKTALHSEEVRKMGNDLFSQKNHDIETHREIFGHYCRSISLAPLESEVLAQAYANRSAFLLHIQKYEDCIKDIDRTLKFTKSDVLTVKLLCRKVECLKKMGLSSYQSVLNAAERYAEKLDKKDKVLVDKFIKKAKTCPTISNDNISRNPNKMLPQVDETLDCISIEYNEKYGRHVIAKKDYSPGDFIFSDNLYVAVLNPYMDYTNCNYCLKVCWSGIACDYCSWAMFCDEDCKKKAWGTFHDVECSVIPYLRKLLPGLFGSMHVSLRTLLIGIKEAGSINQLKEKLKMVDECTDLRYRGFHKNGQFTSSTIQSLYSLKSSGHPLQKLEALASAALFILIIIVKHSQLIKNFKYEKIDDIMANEDLIFLGSLLIKFTTMNINNCYSFTQSTCYCKRLKSLGGENLCCGRGACIAPLASLINHSCRPNANIMFSEDKKAFVYALQPIEKDSQIYITYIGFYFFMHLKDRKKKLENYNFTCECRACMESWPVMSTLFDYDVAPPGVFEKYMYDNCGDILAALDEKKLNFNKNFSEKDAQRLCQTIVQFKGLPEPTLLAPNANKYLLVAKALGNVYSRIYGWAHPMFEFGRCSRL